jgi:hypothetical protein
MYQIMAPLSAGHVAACDAIAGLLLPDGIAVERYDSVSIGTIGGRDEVNGVCLHVTAQRDIPSPVPDADDPLEHAAGDCWQEVWYAWQDPAAAWPGLQAMRVV